MINAVRGLMRPDFHIGRPTVCPRMTDNVRYNVATPKLVARFGIVSRDKTPSRILVATGSTGEGTPPCNDRSG